MRRLLVSFAALALVTASAGCASIEEAYGLPDPFEWTYFEGSPTDVVDALRASFLQTSVVVESIQSEGNGTVITVARRFDGARSTQIYVEATDVEEYQARAQMYPVRDPLPRWLEMDVSGRL